MKLIITIISIILISFSAQAECEISPKFSYKTKGLSASFTNKTLGAFNKVKWDFGDGQTSTKIHPVHIYNSKGIYEFSLTIFTEQGCEETFDGKIYIFNTSKKVKVGPKQPIIKEVTTPIVVTNAKKIKSLSNYPNPFSESTNISFELVEASDVNINVYNMSGKLVRNLANNNYDSGMHQITFDRDNLPTGIYMIQIITGDQNYSHQIMVK